MSVAFVHTAAAHVATFDALMAEMAPAVAVRHVLAAELLAEAVRRGGVDEELAARVRATLRAAAAGAGVVVCTCSTLGPVAESTRADDGTPIQRLDRAMAERAVEIGGRVLVAACLESTLAPTRALLEAAARARGAAVAFELLLVPGAWARFEAGDLPGYCEAIAAALRPAAGGADVVVLAQASMAGAADRLGPLPVPVLSSPRLGVAAALRALARA